MQLTNNMLFRTCAATKPQAEPAVPSDHPLVSRVKPSSKEKMPQPLAVKTAAQSAREKVNADYAKAAGAGERIVSDIANGGRFLDLSSLSDEELAAVANATGFSGDESLTAKATLADRMWAALSPFDGDPRGTALGIKAIYPTLSQNVRDALGWNQSMLDMGERIVRDSGAPERDFEKSSIIQKIHGGQRVPGALKIDLPMVNVRGSSVDLSA